MRHIAIRNIYPEVIVIIDGDGCYDKDNNPVVVDESLVTDEENRLLAIIEANAYKSKRAKEYPDFKEYLDGVVKGDEEQVQAYIDKCLAVKAKYPKGNV
jgi:hypothetical protein